jgi:hypothetical protein
MGGKFSIQMVNSFHYRCYSCYNLGLYAWKAYLDAELSYPITVKDSFLTCSGYRRDSADQNSVTGSGYEKRRDLFARSRQVQFMHKIDADIFNQDLYLVNNVEIDIEITPHNDNFLVIIPENITVAAVGTRGEAGYIAAHLDPNTAEYEVEIINCRLYVKTVDLMDGLSLDIARKLDSQPARYGLRKTRIKSQTITEGVMEYSNVLFSDEVC